MLSLTMLWIDPGRAQTKDEEPKELTEAQLDSVAAYADSIAWEEGVVVVDTLQSGGLFDRLGFHPQLGSNYRVNRTSTVFGESAALQEEYGALILKSRWTVDVTKNSAQANRRQQVGRGLTSLAYDFAELGGWSIGSELGFDRSHTKSDVNRQVDEDDRLGIFVTTEALGAALQDQLGLAEGVIAWSTTGRIDGTQSVSINQSRNRTTRILSNADSTDASGIARSVDSEINLNPAAAFSFRMTAGISRANEDFETDRPLEPDSTRFVSGENADESDAYVITGTYAPSNDTNVGFSASSTRTRIQEYSTTQRAQDTRLGRDEGLSFQVEGRPIWGIELGLDSNVRRIRTTYDLSDQGAGKTSRGLGGNMLAVFGPQFGFFAETEMELIAGIDRSENVYDNTTDYDEDGVNIRMVLRRNFGKRLRATLSGDGDLKQTYYHAQEGQVRDDRDVLRRTLDTSWTFLASPTLNTTLNMQWDERQTINISERKSSANSVETVLSVGAGYDWSVRPSTKLKQRVTINANSSTFAFDEDKSNLFRQSRLETELVTLLSSRANLRFDHEFRFRDSGAFTSLGPGRPRGYAKDTDEVQQILEAETSYQLIPSLLAFYRQRYDVRDVTQIVDGTTSQRDLLESIWGVDVKHTFPKDLVFTLKLERISSSNEPSYWRGQASANRTF
jgi:hypothetical protein